MEYLHEAVARKFRAVTVYEGHGKQSVVDNGLQNRGSVVILYTVQLSHLAPETAYTD
jgi:hypothetical protein